MNMNNVKVIRGEKDQLMVDIVKPELVEVQISDDGRVWVNVDGVCRFRACRCGEVKMVGKPVITSYSAGKGRKI